MILWKKHILCPMQLYWGEEGWQCKRRSQQNGSWVVSKQDHLSSAPQTNQGGSRWASVQPGGIPDGDRPTPWDHGGRFDRGTWLAVVVDLHLGLHLQSGLHASSIHASSESTSGRNKFGWVFGITYQNLQKVRQKRAKSSNLSKFPN